MTQTSLHVTQLLDFLGWVAFIRPPAITSAKSRIARGWQGAGWCNWGLIFAVHYGRLVEMLYTTHTVAIRGVGRRVWT